MMACMLVVLCLQADDAKQAEAAGRAAVLAGDWAKALPCLAKAGNAALAKAATTELAGDATKYGRIEIGDMWVTAAATERKDKAAWLAHAATFYGLAWGDELDPVWRDKLRTRLYKLANLPPGWQRKPASAADRITGFVAFTEIEGAYLDTTFAHTGRASAKMVYPVKNTNKEGVHGSEKVPHKAGASYKVSAWVFSAETTAPGLLGMRWFDAAGQLLGGAGPDIPADAPYWQRVEATFTPPAGTASVCLCYITRSPAGALWVDDVSLTCEGKELLKNNGYELR